MPSSAAGSRRQFERRAQALARRREVAEHGVDARGLHQRPSHGRVVAMLACQPFGLGEAVECLGVLAEFAARGGELHDDLALRGDVVLRAIDVLRVRQLPDRA